MGEYLEQPAFSAVCKIDVNAIITFHCPLNSYSVAACMAGAALVVCQFSTCCV